jgi:hypothetical protein
LLDDPFNNFTHWRQLDDGTYIAIGRLMFSVALFIDVQPITPYRKRFCFPSLDLAIAAYTDMQTPDDVPTGWIARRPETQEDVEAKAMPDYDPSVFWPENKKKENEQ